MRDELRATRPADISKISFDRECFVQTGVQVVWTSYSPVGWGSPKRFTDEQEAREFARKRNWELSRSEEPILERVRWNLDS